MKKTVFILIDAFRFDYLSRGITPFLSKEITKGEYYEKVIPGNGFCERSEIFTGKNQIETGLFTAIAPRREKNIFNKISVIVNIFHLIYKIAPLNIVDKILRRVLWEITQRSKKPMHPYKIPYSMLKYFSLTEDYTDMRERNALGHKSIFDILNDRNLKYFYDSFTALNLPSLGDDQSRLNHALDNSAKDYSAYFIYLGEVDMTGHYKGPNSKEMNDKIRETDLKIQSFVEKFREKSPNSDFIFLGDHGMVNIDKTVDPRPIINEVIKKFSLKLGENFRYFLDSTLIRIWVKDKILRKLVKEHLLKNENLASNGRFISENDSSKYLIPFDENSANIIWWANPGVLVAPDFFHNSNENIKGMHGYMNNYDESKGFCLYVGSKTKPNKVKEIHLTEVFDIFKRSID